MRRAAGLLLALACLSPAGGLAQEAPSAAGLIREGIALHDKGDYDGAVRKYREALKAEPESAEAYYELGFSLKAKHDVKGAIEATRAGLKLPSRNRPALHLLLGNCLDDLGDSQGAIRAYQDGITERPDLSLLHFNLGVTYGRLGRFDEARRALQRAVSLNPDHASSHDALARVYEEGGYVVPAILAWFRFLSLEPASARSAPAVQALDRLFRRGFEPEKTGDVRLTLDAEAKTDEGDFSAVQLAVLLGQASSHRDERQSKKKEPELSVERMASETALIGEVSPKSGGFAAEYYAPFLAALHEQKLDTVFAWYAHQSAGDEVRQWLGKHEAEVAALKKWLAGYRWPEAAKETPKAAP